MLLHYFQSGRQRNGKINGSFVTEALQDTVSHSVFGSMRLLRFIRFHTKRPSQCRDLLQNDATGGVCVFEWQCMF